MDRTCKKNPNCPYRDRPKHIYPCTECKEPQEQYPLTCRNCRKYPCKGEKQSLRTCKEFMWD